MEFRFNMTNIIDPSNHEFNPPLPKIERGKYCERCSLMLAVVLVPKNAGGGGNSWVLHRNGADMVSGLRDHCWWCLQIKRNEEEGTAPGNEGQGHGREGVTLFRTDGRMQLGWNRTRWSIVVKTCHSTNAFVIRDFDESEEWAKVLSDRTAGILLDSNTSGPSTLRYLAECLANCTKNHTHCQNAELWVPTRLVEVKKLGKGPQLRIVTTSSWREKKPYISLSHRWGANTTLRLTSETSASYHQEIPFNELPRKYTDAAEMAMQLGIQYLWIDSLCIVQDSITDWEFESSQMHLVYRNSYCNLSAASAGSDEGLFFDRDITLFPPHFFSSTYTAKQNLVAVPWHHLQRFRNLDYEPLYARAWVCQERLLSTRNISFTSAMVFFECSEEFSCEVEDTKSRLYPAGTVAELGPITHGFRARFTSRDGPHPGYFSTRNLYLQPNIYGEWNEVVQFYSACQLTVSTDKFIAIAGVAQVFQKALSTTYVAGLWAENMVKGLLWRAKATSQNLSGFPAPTWSWVSLAAPISTGQFSGKELLLAKCEEVKVTHSTSNPFGPVQSGTVRLNCYVFPLFTEGQAEQSSKTVQDQIREAFKSHCEAELSINIYYDGPRGTPDILWDIPCAAYYVVPMQVSKKGANFLLLQAVTPALGLYRRVGLMRAMRSMATTVEREEFKWQTREDLPEVYKEGSRLGFSKFVCYSLALMVEKSMRAKVPSHGKATGGEHIITLV